MFGENENFFSAVAMSSGNFYYLFGQEMKPSKSLFGNGSCSEN